MTHHTRANRSDDTQLSQHIAALPKWLRVIVIGNILLMVVIAIVLYFAVVICMLLSVSGTLWLCLNGLTCSKYSACFDVPIVPFWFVFTCATLIHVTLEIKSR